MIFPFKIKFSTQIIGTISPENSQLIVNFIKDYIVKRKGQDIKIEKDHLTFKTNLFKMSSFDILSPVEKGIFYIKVKEQNLSLVYEIFMFRLFIISIIMSIIFGILTTDIRIGIFAFLWLGGMNWITAILRNRIMLNKIAKGIVTLQSKKQIVEH